MTDFQHLLALRDERRAACPDRRVDAIVIERLKGQMVPTLRQAIDDLGKTECERQPALSPRIDAETEWIRAVAAAFAGPDA